MGPHRRWGGAISAVNLGAKRRVRGGGIYSRRAFEVYPEPPAGKSRVGNHADNEFNNRCDELAVAESKKYKGSNSAEALKNN